MRKIDVLFADYAAYHQTAGNKNFHRLGIPMIMFSLIGMLARVHVATVGGFAIDAGMLLIAVASLWYLAVEWRLGILMLLVSVAMWYAGGRIPLWVNVTLFVLGWVFQFIGHSVYEHRQPAFFRNFVHLLVGPLWILNGFIPVVKPPSSVSAAV